MNRRIIRKSLQPQHVSDGFFQFHWKAALPGNPPLPRCRWHPVFQPQSVVCCHPCHGKRHKFAAHLGDGTKKNLSVQVTQTKRPFSPTNVGGHQQPLNGSINHLSKGHIELPGWFCFSACFCFRDFFVLLGKGIFGYDPK